METEKKNINGILLFNKPVGISSQTAVSKVKNLLFAKKAGHLGTLDPLASGVLPITFGKSTRLFDYFLNKRKKYLAVFAFGFETDTLDCEGQIINQINKDINLNKINEILKDFVGEIEQIPPKYSSKNINGEKAYDLARKGINFEIKPKQITIFDLKVQETSEDLKKITIETFKNFNKSEDKTDIINDYFNQLYTFEITCSAGTYIRSLCRDIAKSLGTSGTMVYLNRTECGEFVLKDCFNFKDIETGNYKILKPEEVINLENLEIDKNLCKKLLCGQKVEASFEGQRKLFSENKFLGICSSQNNILKIDTFLMED